MSALGSSDLQFVNALQKINFTYFLRSAFAHLHGGQDLKANWHHEAITFELELVRRGNNRRLIVNLPPRCLKSEMVSVAWVAWMLGHNPKLNFVCVSYSDQLATDFARQCLSIMEADWYRAIFPGTVLVRRAALNFQTSLGGGRLATSIDGTLTGRGGDIVIIDDPGKPEEALSVAMRTKVIRWFQSTLLSRLDDKVTGSIILVMQRLHHEDLAGYLLEQDEWRHLCLPAIATRDTEVPLLFGKVHHCKMGDLLHPEHLPLVELQRLEKGSGAFAWNAQYQQAPVSELGNLIKRDWLKYYEPNELPHGRIIQSWDTASRIGPNNDWSVGITALVNSNKVYILDVLRGRWEFPDLQKKVIAKAQEYAPSALLIEDKGSGQELISMLRRANVSRVPYPLGCHPKTDKLGRIQAQSARIEAGHVFLPKQAPWLTAFVEEIIAVPAGKHDDQADALSQLLGWHGTWQVVMSGCEDVYIPPPASDFDDDDLDGPDIEDPDGWGCLDYF